ncbi:MAG: hypothetical protein K6E51_03200 [Treponema sp.]|nr:hypothetical protein [Treponema sp.]
MGKKNKNESQMDNNFYLSGSDSSEVSDEQKFKRFDIICSQAIEEDFTKAFSDYKIRCYTEAPEVRGTGYSTPKLGTDVWPQLNVLFTLFCQKEDAKKVKHILKTIRKQYPNEGIACYMSKAKEL